MDIFWEKQQSGLCRMHAINAFYGYKKYNIDEFNLLCNEYDTEKNKLYNGIISCKLFDLIYSDQQNIISYIIHKTHYTKYYPINYIYLNKISKDDFYCIHNDADLTSFFIYNDAHIWLIKKHSNKWYNVDSISGVSELNCVNIYEYIKSIKNAGFIIMVNHILYFYSNLKLIKQEIKDTLFIQDYLKKKNKEKQILGDIEVPLNICIDILKYVLIKKSKEEQNNIFLPIKNITDSYDIFIKKFTYSNYNNIELILEFLPSVLTKLFNIELLSKIE